MNWQKILLGDIKLSQFQLIFFMKNILILIHLEFQNKYKLKYNQKIRMLTCNLKAAVKVSINLHIIYN